MDKKNLKGRFSDSYENLAPKKKQQLMLLGGGSLILVISAILVAATSDDTAEPRKKARKIEYSLFNGKNPREVSMDALSGKIKSLTDDLSEMRISYQQQDKKIKEAGDLIVENNKAVKQQADELKKQYEALSVKLDAAQDILDNQVPLPDISDTKIPPGLNKKEPRPAYRQPPEISDADVAVDSGLKIRVITGFGEEGKKKSGSSPAQTSSLANSTEIAKKREAQKRIIETVNIKKANSATGQPDIYLPSGTILSGTLMTGLDAPTSNQSRLDPFPALLRVKHEALLPNKYRMDIAECFVIASGFGDLSAERAYMRAERLSCVKKDGTVIETPMDAYSVGEDGKAGIRGRVVSKNGQIIGNALLSGFIAGLGKAFTPQRVQPLSLNPSGTTQFQYPSPEMVAGQSIGGGVNGAAEQLASYYLEMARNIFPIVEIDAGRKIDLILVRGMALTGKSRSTAILSDRVASNAYNTPTLNHNNRSGLAGFNPNGGNSGSGYYR
jgi:conjugal transfer pilus assembly protein TraB